VKRKSVSIVFATIFILLTGTVAAVFIGYRNKLDGGNSPLAIISEEASVSIGKVHHTATRDGKTEWKLDAKSADYFPGKQEVMFKDLSAVFYLEDGRQVELTADRGVLQKVTNDIEVTGNVQVMDDRFELNTQKLQYEHASKSISTSERVRLVSEGWDLEADSMAMDLFTRKTRFEGRVEGFFDETFSF
jgi:LPS export ABC transporter protein LptC